MENTDIDKTSQIPGMKDLLIIFGRYPVPAKVKTRLIPTLGPVGAAELQRKLTEKALIVAQRAALAHGRNTDIEFNFLGGSIQQMRKWLGPGPRFTLQADGDLGQKMEAALNSAFEAGYGRVILFGTDIPGIGEEPLLEALAALDESDVVLGQTHDGGYWLMGLNRPQSLFQGVSWGQKDVFNRTVALARDLGLSVHQLDKTYGDLDTPGDLDHLLPQEKDAPYLSIVIPTLNEAENIGSILAHTFEMAEGNRVEVLVADGGSLDSTLELAKNAGAKIVKCPPGRSVQQNMGAAQATGQVILFLHADTWLPENFVGHIFEALMPPGVMLGAFSFKTDLDTSGMRVIEALANFRSSKLNLPYGDQGIFLRKSVFEASKGFEQVPIAEDLFFVRKMSRQGSIVTSQARAITSARRWREKGLFKTTLINQIMVLGCLFGLPITWLKKLY